jgi:hypothetical protein
MQHIDLTSQMVRHQMLMDLATAVTLHRDNNPEEHQQQEPDVYPVPTGHTSYSGK